ncbi:MAG: RsmE family RNA methyltransferase [Planctomycetota bacterium]
MATHLPRARAELGDDQLAGDATMLQADVARHLTRSRRLGDGDEIEVFDGTGRSARAKLIVSHETVIAELLEAPTVVRLPSLVMCVAVPKGQRADWLAEKLAELGVTRWVPLVTERSVVNPGHNKLDRWRRLASAAATQSHAPETLDVARPMSLADALAHVGPGAVYTTERDATVSDGATPAIHYIGPEGGWTDRELEAFAAAGCSFATLGPTILRIETAAILAAGLVRFAGD